MGRPEFPDYTFAAATCLLTDLQTQTDRSQVGNVATAIADARAFTAEVISTLKPSAAVGEAA